MGVGVITAHPLDILTLPHFYCDSIVTALDVPGDGDPSDPQTAKTSGVIFFDKQKYLL